MALSLALALAVIGCADGDGITDSNGLNTPQPGSTADIATATNAPNETIATGEPSDTPTAFETLRDELRDRLDAIGASIGDTPSDIREQLLTSCRELGEYVDSDRVEPICRDIEDAMDRSDPGKIDLVMDYLAELKQN
jgi:hypothetical protein